jgi:hypothetical protein
MKPVLVACETSGKVRDALIAKGIDAISCDTQPTKRSGPHIQKPLERVIGDGSKWSGIIAFPPCTYVCSSGLHWNKRINGRSEKTDSALNFIVMILNAIERCGKGALENPIGCISTRVHFDDYGKEYIVLNEPNPKHAIKPAQIIQPYFFGHNASKSTCLYLFGLPKLKRTKFVAPRVSNGKLLWDNQTDTGQNRLPPSDNRGDIRSITYTGVAKAMANQWAKYFKP